MTTGIIISIITLAMSIIATFCKFTYDYSRHSTKMSEIEKDIVEYRKQLNELYQSRLETNSAIAKLTESNYASKDRLDRIESKIDLLLTRGKNNEIY